MRTPPLPHFLVSTVHYLAQASIVL